MSETTTRSYWPKIALGLVILTILYNIAEAVLAISFGLEAESISLVGFGFDSIIEVSAAGVMLWRLTQEFAHVSECQLEAREKFVRRFVGATFILLAAYILYQSATDLWFQTKPSESIIGIILAILSLIIMPLLAWGKMKAADHIGSEALRLEAKETIACSLLSLILLLGLSLNALFGWWWADPVAALTMVPWLIKEGREGLRGESCCGD